MLRTWSHIRNTIIKLSITVSWNNPAASIEAFFMFSLIFHRYCSDSPCKANLLCSQCKNILLHYVMFRWSACIMLNAQLLNLTFPKFCRQVGPICLPCSLRNADFSGATVTASGWGSTQEGNRTTPPVIRKVDLPVLTTKQCRRYFNPRTRITNNMFCTYRQGKDTCQGDSGTVRYCFHVFFQRLTCRLYYWWLWTKFV